MHPGVSVHCKERRIDSVVKDMISREEKSKQSLSGLHFAGRELVFGGGRAVQVKQPDSRAGNRWTAMTVAGGQVGE